MITTDGVRRDGADILLEVSVQPRATRTGFAGVHGGRLRIRLAAPPLDGRANAALIDFLAAAFGVPKARVILVRGEKSRLKTVRVQAPSAVPGWLTGS
ncbi:MAG TPA: DUF167 family protein [Steroidobacteraceae bacterium]|nr:DUF167 family protein [Steroidobacteraceae bacterium]